MSAVEVKSLPGRGRGLVTTRHVEAGEIILVEEPLLLTVSQEAKNHACANCMCWLEHCPGAVKCDQCQQAAFCSPQCQQQAASKPWVHAEGTCRAYSQLEQLLPGNAEAQTSLRFLIQAAALKHSTSHSSSTNGQQQQHSGYAVLLSLVGEPTAASLAQAAVLQPALCKAVGDPSGAVLSVAEAAALLIKEQLNSYGLLAPLEQQTAYGSRVIRGGGIYTTCALINHECLPNVARFDALDAAADGRWPAHWPGRTDSTCKCSTAAAAVPSPSSSSSGCSTTAVVMRALHALPPGTEVTQSYFPLNWELVDRQQQAQQVYGFVCTCPRCVLESSPEWQQQHGDGDNGSSGEWETDSEGAAAAAQEEESDDHEMDNAESDEQHQQQHDEVAAAVMAAVHKQQAEQQQQPTEPLDPAYLSIFMLKYVCPRDGCYGTMAAVHGAQVCECSVCGATRTDAQFLAELQQ